VFSRAYVEKEGLSVAPQVGFEPTTLRLTAESSRALFRNIGSYGRPSGDFQIPVARNRLGYYSELAVVPASRAHIWPTLHRGTAGRQPDGLSYRAGVEEYTTCVGCPMIAGTQLVMRWVECSI
jgi:hypothetical protein